MSNLEYQRRDYYDNLREERDTAMVALLCPECGDVDGMVAVDRVGVHNCPGLDYYRRLDIQHEVFTTCPECNPARRIPPGYCLVVASYLHVWDNTPCTCADCRRERKE